MTTSHTQSSPSREPHRWTGSAHARNLREFIGWLFQRHQALGGVTEIRILGKGTLKGVWSAFLQPGDEDWLVSAVAPLSWVPRERLPHDAHPRIGEANLYFTLNPVAPGMRPSRRFRKVYTTARDTDIVAYSILAIDVDPERRPRDSAATQAEKEAARQVADAIRAWLATRGVKPLFADSGNGYHLLVPLAPGGPPSSAPRAGVRPLAHRSPLGRILARVSGSIGGER